MGKAFVGAVLLALVLAVGIIAVPRALSPRVSSDQAAAIAMREVNGAGWQVVSARLQLTDSRIVQGDGDLGGAALSGLDQVHRVWLVELQAPAGPGPAISRAAVLVDADTGAVFEVVKSAG